MTKEGNFTVLLEYVTHITLQNTQNNRYHYIYRGRHYEHMAAVLCLHQGQLRTQTLIFNFHRAKHCILLIGSKKKYWCIASRRAQSSNKVNVLLHVAMDRINICP